jgi:hypothetical protein
MKKFTISLFTFMFALACTNREDNEYKKNAEKYIGEYSAFSMTSDTPIDANFDGAYNTNLFEEFSLSVRIRPIRVLDLQDVNRQAVIVVSMINNKICFIVPIFKFRSKIELIFTFLNTNM